MLEGRTPSVVLGNFMPIKSSVLRLGLAKRVRQCAPRTTVDDQNFTSRRRNFRD